MLNTDHFTLLAGRPEGWDAEIKSAHEQDREAGSCSDPDFNLCRMQEDQFGRGRRSAILVKTMYGWSVRSDTGLDGHRILFGSRQAHARGEDCSRETAIAWGKTWANEDPTRREFYARNDDLTD